MLFKQVGGRRSHDLRQLSSLLPYFGSGPYVTNSTGSGYYTVDDYRDILRHASKLHIDVIPEIDLPGHAHAAVQSMRAHSTGDQAAANLLSDPEDKSMYEAVNRHKDTVVNPCLESTYLFVEQVLLALKKMHEVKFLHVCKNCVTF